jgi:hypothetical protein
MARAAIRERLLLGAGPDGRFRPGAVVCERRLMAHHLLMLTAACHLQALGPAWSGALPSIPCVAQPPHPLVAVDQVLWPAVASKLEDSGSTDFAGSKRRSHASELALVLASSAEVTAILNDVTNFLKPGPAEELPAGLDPRRNCLGRDAPASHVVRAATPSRGSGTLASRRTRRRRSSDRSTASWGLGAVQGHLGRADSVLTSA